MSNDKSAEEIVRGRIDDIRARCEAATPGPWTEDGYGSMIWAEDPYGNGRMRVLDVRGWGHLTGTGACHFTEKKATEIQVANAALSAGAREDIPFLLERIAELEGQLEAKEVVNKLHLATLRLVGADKDTAIHRMEEAEARLAASQQETRATVEDFESAARNGNILCEFCGADCIDAGDDTGGDTDQCGCFVYRGQKAGEGERDG